MSRRWAWAASRASSVATRPSSASRRRATYSHSAFLDLPYGRDLATRALACLVGGGWLAEGALILVEEGAEAPLVLPEGVVEAERRRYGDTQIVFARRRRDGVAPVRTDFTSLPA